MIECMPAWYLGGSEGVCLTVLINWLDVREHRSPADILHGVDALVGYRDIDDDAKFGGIVGRALRVQTAPGDVDLLVDVPLHQADEVLILHLEEGIDALLYLVL